MPQNELHASQTGNDTGVLRINVISALGMIPVAGATITIADTANPTEIIATLTTDESGLTEDIRLSTPPLALSLTPSDIQPYAEYNIEVVAEGYEPVQIFGSQLLANEFSFQSVRMNPLEITEEDEKIVVIPPHTLFGDFPPKIPEAEIKPLPESGEIVLSRVVIPEYIIVHDGVPSDRSAPNYWVKYTDYIKNVASSEIYSTWPEATIYANILAIMSFTLNRVFTEWYHRIH
ncbi:MAG: carboxypeptidase regulatory-like domain-containing protein [Lachnospiraceae bacterium]|nr:carboxypeptidase regulatory-like domain-containing protein [Lachnospiraceae bacterium]